MDWLGIFRIVYFLGAVNALFFSVLIFSKKQKSLADKILAWWLIVLSVQLIYPFLYLTDMVKYQQFIGYEASLTMLHPAGLFFYTKAMVRRLKFDKKTIILLILILFSFLSVFGFMSQMPDDRIKIFDSHDFLQYFDSLGKIIVGIVTAVYISLFAYFLLRSNYLLKNYKKRIEDIYSNREKVDLQWLRRLILFFYICYAITIIASIVIFIWGTSMAFTDYFYYLMIVVFVFLIGYWGHQQGNVFNMESNSKISEDNNQQQVETSDKNNGTRYRKEALVLKKIMEEEKPYLEPMLTVHDLSHYLDIPSHQLSKLIHKEFGKNFYEFVNHYRIEWFKKLVMSEKYKNFTILAIAFECGFNSKSAFNRIFKEQTGLTPRDYKLQKALNKSQVV